MSAPEIPSGWDASLGLLDRQLDGSLADRLFTLASIHRRYLELVSPGLIDFAYAYARNQLKDRHDLPAGGPYQTMLFRRKDLVNTMFGNFAIGGGLQFNVSDADGQDLAVRTQVYSLDTQPFEEMQPFDTDHAEAVYLALDGVREACDYRQGRLGVEFDLATLINDPMPRRLVTVKY